MKSLAPPVSYQGGKQRIADAVARILLSQEPESVADLCCGSGAVAIALVNAGYPPCRITMLDAGPWGLVWESIGRGEFSMERMRALASLVPRDITKIQDFMLDLSRQPVNDDAPYIYLLLQSSSFGGKALWIENGRWRNCSFRSYWLPTPTSSRRSPVNPMMPMVATLIERLDSVCAAMMGVRAAQAKVENYRPGEQELVYIDPPYGKTTKYGHELDVLAYARLLSNTVYISEGRPLSSNSIQLSGAGERAKGGISGERLTANEEWLSRSPFGERT
jgi:site-specific DNA-adenine methylase